MHKLTVTMLFAPPWKVGIIPILLGWLAHYVAIRWSEQWLDVDHKFNRTLINLESQGLTHGGRHEDLELVRAVRNVFYTGWRR